ncbi:hypothetical protein P1J78_18575 [Psychromarinibacter sp. C21-152]|uniref:Uncharacterized protein n=1 Tax=Psychromarinibacter sediminicola TaxID=3033385 RepID=A0AAE3T9L8_9RHOB|nr:hypothetical protein [Psychromarinibacter sediminicola]MDF0602750.1 hypothetical protein [Psychromarinibacter sediminicola]
MTPPDTNVKKQQRRHRGPLIGMGLVALFGIGIILYWIAEEVYFAPGPEEPADPTVEERNEGDVSLPADAPVEDLAPEDPEVEVGPSGPDPTDD